jgi:porin
MRAREWICAEDEAMVDRLSLVKGFGLVALVPMTLALPAWGQSAPQPSGGIDANATTPDREWFGHKRWRDWGRATGDWGGARTHLEDNGITFNGSLTTDWGTVLLGGLRQKGSSRTLLDLNVAFDLETLAGIEGGTVYADYYSTDGRGGSEDVGDYLGVSNIYTGDNVHQLAELWYEQWLFEKKARLKVGKVDANYEFAYFKTATADFVSYGAYNNLVLFPVFPTIPNPATGVNLFVYPTDRWYAGVGFYDGSVAEGVNTGRRGPSTFFDGGAYFLVGETGFTWEQAGTWGQGRANLGVWYSTADVVAFDGDEEDGQAGFYLMAEQQITRRGEGDLASKGLWGFAQYARGDDDVNPVANQFTLGVATFGTFASRDNDGAGLMLNWLDMSDADGAGFESDEWNLEAYYKIQVTPAISVTPDVQYVINPSGSRDVDDAVVAQVRINIVF